MLQSLLQISTAQPLQSYKTTKDWSIAYYQLTKEKAPIDKAILGGFTCQQFSFAFMAGYQAALTQMFPTIAPNELKALCVSEAGGGHPKAIQTTLVDNQLNGIKTYVTAGSEVAHLLVLCKTNQAANGHPVLKMVHVPSHSPHTEITNFELAFMRDVKHGKLTLQNTKITETQILEGDGYSDYTKPFRTLEDICVGAAYQAMLLRQAIENNWEANVRDSILLNIYTLKNLLTLPPSAPATHLLLAANEQHFENNLPSIEANIATNTPIPFREDWTLNKKVVSCLLYTSPSPRDRTRSRMPSSA